MLRPATNSYTGVTYCIAIGTSDQVMMICILRCWLTDSYAPIVIVKPVCPPYSCPPAHIYMSYPPHENNIKYRFQNKKELAE